MATLPKFSDFVGMQNTDLQYRAYCMEQRNKGARTVLTRIAFEVQLHFWKISK